MQPPELTTDGLFLRGWRAEDAVAVHRACQDPDIQRWTAVPSPYEPERAARFVTEIAPNAWSDGSGAPFAVCDASTGELLASCGLVSIDRCGRWAEIGYWTAPWARGRGVAVRATRAVARWAFEMLGVRRIVWQAEVGNHASRLVAVRSGFMIDGVVRLAEPHPQGGLDGWIGSLLPADLDRPVDEERSGSQSLEARRAAVFGAGQPLLATRGGRVTLRPLAARDVDAMVVTCRDPQTIRWTGVPDPYERSHAEQFLHEVARPAWARGTGAYFALADANDAYVGSLDLRISKADPLVANIGFMTAPHARGRGHQPAALTALCEWAFTALGLARIEWRAYVGNEASRRAVEKAGFVFEGTARGAVTHRGKRADAWIGARLAEDAAP